MEPKELEFKYTNYKGEVGQRKVIPDRIEFGLNPNITEPKWLMYGFDIDKQAERAFVVEHMSPVPHEMQFERHFCVTTYVQDSCSGKYLFIKHKKLGKWLPPGGHVEANELPDQAAIRECKEETGIDIELKGERGPVETALVRPFGIQRNVIKVGQHEHMDLIYLAIAVNSTEIINNEAETNGAQWLSVDELSSGKFETFPEVVQWVKYFETQKK